MQKLSDYYVLEWSDDQKCFHVHTLGDMIQKNSDIYINGSKTDYVPIAIGRDYEELSKIKTKLFQKLIREHDKIHPEFI